MFEKLWSNEPSYWKPPFDTELKDDFPLQGESWRLYLEKSSNFIYVWVKDNYVQLVDRGKCPTCGK